MDYPRDQLEFEDAFRTESECEEFFKRIRWKEGFQCQCGSKEFWPQSRGRFTCKACKHETTLKSGTMFEGSRLKLRLWFRAMWWVLNQKHGTSALGLQKGLGIKSYETAWLMLHKIRSAMVDPNRSKLKGDIEIDEAWIGGKKQGGSVKSNKGNPMIIVAIEYSAKRLGRVRMKYTDARDTQTIVAFVNENIELKSHIHSDRWPGYNKLWSLGYGLSQVKAAGNDYDENDVLPRVHLVISLLKNWLDGTHHGRVERQHLQAYLDEFTFRFNRRTSQSRGLLFKRLLENAIYASGPTYEKLVKKSKRN